MKGKTRWDEQKQENARSNPGAAERYRALRSYCDFIPDPSLQSELNFVLLASQRSFKPAANDMKTTHCEI